MPNREFLETYPLYRKFEGFFGHDLSQIPKVPVKLPCTGCNSEQTFVMLNEYWEGFDYSNFPAGGAVSRLRYVCTSCQSSSRSFLVLFDEDKSWVMKVGQWPAWEIRSDRAVERMLGAHASFYRKGLVCESQGYGIGAFSYYRRIVEELIDRLLSEIGELLAGTEHDSYMAAYEQVKTTVVAQDKIALVKDLLPANLRPDGLNPLSILHSTLSQGLHAESDDECLAAAASVREVLVFLVSRVEGANQAKKSFTESMRKLLSKKTAPSS